jgi:cobalt-zinc-cadmium efflux system outer membrane protein
MHSDKPKSYRERRRRCSPDSSNKTLARLLMVAVLATPLQPAAAQQTAGLEPLTEASAVRRGLARAALVELEEGSHGLAEATAVAEGTWPNPLLSYSREHTSDSTEDFAWLSQELDLSGRRSLRTQAASQRATAAALKMAVQRLEVAAAIRHRFHEVLYHQRRVAALHDWLAGIDRALETVTRREEAGDASVYDRRRLERERASGGARLAVAEAGLDRAWAGLLAQLPEPVPVATEGPAVAGRLLPEDDPPPLVELLAALPARPDLQSLEARVAAAELDGRAARRWQLPRVSLGGGVKRVDTDGEWDNGFLLTASLPLPLFDRHQDEALRARAEERLAWGRSAEALAMAGGEVRGLWAESRRLTTAARHYREQTARTSAVLVRTAEAAYRGGELGILELLDAHRSVLEDELQALDLEMAARRARIELDRITGGQSQ